MSAHVTGTCKRCGKELGASWRNQWESWLNAETEVRRGSRRKDGQVKADTAVPLDGTNMLELEEHAAGRTRSWKNMQLEEHA